MTFNNITFYGTGYTLAAAAGSIPAVVGRMLGSTSYDTKNLADIPSPGISLFDAEKKRYTFMIDGASAETVYIGGAVFAGESRYETADDIANFAFPDGCDTAVFALGDDWPDALAGSALEARVDGPILLVDGNASVLSEAQLQNITAASKLVFVIGGPGAVCSEMRQSIQKAAFG